MQAIPISSPPAEPRPGGFNAVYPPTQLARQAAKDAGRLLEDAPLVSSNFICDFSSFFVRLPKGDIPPLVAFVVKEDGGLSQEAVGSERIEDMRHAKLRLQQFDSNDFQFCTVQPRTLRTPNNKEFPIR